MRGSTRIERYEFGKIRVAGREYTRDVVVAPEGVVEERWWRVEGHLLRVEDIARYVEEQRPSVLVVGTGYFGMLRVDRGLVEYLRVKGVELVALKTGDAVKEFNNRVERGERVLGAFHLTC